MSVGRGGMEYGAVERKSTHLILRTVLCCNQKLSIGKVKGPRKKKGLYIEFLPFGSGRLLILFLLLLQLFGEITFTVAMRLWFRFVDTKNPGYITFV